MNRFFSSVKFDTSGTLEGIRLRINEALSDSPGGVILLVGSESNIDLESLPDVLKDIPVPAIATILPGVIYQSCLYSKAVIVCGMASLNSIHFIQDINKPESELGQEISRQLSSERKTRSALLIIDGLSTGVDNFINCAFDELGPDVDIIGFGCGHTDFSSRPSIITTGGCWKNAAILVFLEPPLATSYLHGWKEVAGPFLVTRAENNQIHDINYQPALPFYQSIVQQHSESIFDTENFFNTSSHYPLGLEQFESEYLVRDLITYHGTSIECAGAVPTNAMVYVLNANEEQLISAAGQAASSIGQKLSPQYGEQDGLHIFVIDCVSRKLTLGDQFNRELDCIHQNLPQGITSIGVLSIGEIASSSQGNIQFLNKTTVIGGLG